jgi:hypothetical protein
MSTIRCLAQRRSCLQATSPRKYRQLPSLGGTRGLSLSSVVGAIEPPLDERTLPNYYAQQLLPTLADRPALVCRGERRNAFGGPMQRNEGLHLRWTFEELEGHAAALARGLSGMGVKKGDRVAVIMGNTR